MKEKEQEQAEQELVSEEEKKASLEEDTLSVQAEDEEEEGEEEEVDVDDDDEEDPPLSPEEQLKEEVKRLETSLLRAHADLENFKRRTARERQESIKYANKQIFLAMLDVIDNFERALSSVPDPKDNLAIGVKMIHKQLLDVFSQHGVEPIEAINRVFDPYLHEALVSEVTEEVPENTVMEEFQKGFRFHDKLLRPSKVKVAVAPDSPEGESEEEIIAPDEEE